MKPTNVLIYLILYCFPLLVNAQIVNPGLADTSQGEKIKNITIAGYIDAYYGFFSGRPADGFVPYFVSMNRHNELTINLAFIDLRYQTNRVRGRFTPGFGTYMNANYRSEPGVLKNILEATIGFKLFASKNIWMDAGILGSPYTNESAISKDHFMYTRSLAPEYVPYYLSGVKFTLPLNKKFTFYLYLLNGWQQIQDVNTGKSIGTQLEFRPDNKNLINWNLYVGNEESVGNPDFSTRLFSDIYWIYNPDGRWSFTSCIYGGIQDYSGQKALTEKVWWQMNFMTKFRYNQKSSVAARIEYFSDPNGIQIMPVTGQRSFSSFSTGPCLNYNPTENSMLRLEGRYFLSRNSVFTDANGKEAKSAWWFIAGTTLWF